MNKHKKILKDAEMKLASGLLDKHGIICKQIQFGDSPVLYLAKPNWTNRFDKKRESTIGIFYGLWVSPKQLEKNEYAYNIHSKKLRELPGYKLEPRSFADDFRKAVKTKVKNWPNIRLDYGPSTLLQGRDRCDLDTFEEKIEQRVNDFIKIHKEIDKLLKKGEL